MIYVLVEFKDGRARVAPFARLRGIGRYAADVIAGRKALNLWRIVASVHPLTGEAVAMRSRTVVAGDTIESMTVVRPKAIGASFGESNTNTVTQDDIDNLRPGAFAPAVEPQSCGFGTFTLLADYTRTDGVAIPAGTELPVHRDASSNGERYVIVNAESGERYFYERVETLPGDGDDTDAEYADEDGADDE